jgi:O-antigen ligase
VTNDILVMIAVPLLLVGSVLLIARPVLGLFLLALTIPLESTLMLGGRTVPALMGMAVFMAWGTQKLLRRESLVALVSPGLVQVAIVLLLFASLSVLWAVHTQVVRGPVILLAQLIVLCVVVWDLASSWNRVGWVLKLVVLGATLAALLTIEQYFIGGARRAGEGVIGGVNRTAVTLVTILPLAFYLFRSNETAFWRLLGLSYVGLAAIAVAGTLSRANFLLYPLVVAIHLALMAKTRGGRRRVVLLGAGLVIAMWFLPMEAVRQRVDTIAPYISQSVGAGERSETYTTRAFVLRLGLEMFKDRPLVGYGYNNYYYMVQSYQWSVSGNPYGFLTYGKSAESSYVYFLANLGIVGFLLWLSLPGIALTYIYGAWRTVRDPTSREAFLVQAVGIAVGLQLLYGLYHEVHQDKIVWVLFGLAMAVSRLAKPQMMRSRSDPRQLRPAGVEVGRQQRLRIGTSEG